MNESVGEVFSFAGRHAPVAGCTLSGRLAKDIDYYALAAHTDISAEIYPYDKFLAVLDGEAEAYGAQRSLARAGRCVLLPRDRAVGIRTDSGAVYLEFLIRSAENMNEMIKAGEVFSLAETVPYRTGEIVNMDLVHHEKMKFVVMAFDAGTGLDEHAAPGEAMIFALDGQGVIGYEGQEHTIKAGENFCFAKGGRHWVRADGKFKMALLLTLE